MVIATKQFTTNLDDWLRKRVEKTYCVGIEPSNNNIHPTIRGNKAELTTYKEQVIKLNNEYHFLQFPFLENLFKKENEKRSFREALIKVLEKNDYNLLLSFFRNKVLDPIANKEYGHNTQSTINVKGFDWLLVDSGLMMKNIKSWVEKNDDDNKK
jgi:hypothetical protein